MFWYLSLPRRWVVHQLSPRGSPASCRPERQTGLCGSEPAGSPRAWPGAAGSLLPGLHSSAIHQLDACLWWVCSTKIKDKHALPCVLWSVLAALDMSIKRRMRIEDNGCLTRVPLDCLLGDNLFVLYTIFISINVFIWSQSSRLTGTLIPCLCVMSYFVFTYQYSLYYLGELFQPCKMMSATCFVMLSNKNNKKWFSHKYKHGEEEVATLPS